jgi:hypothetical protein
MTTPSEEYTSRSGGRWRGFGPEGSPAIGSGRGWPARVRAAVRKTLKGARRRLPERRISIQVFSSAGGSRGSPRDRIPQLAPVAPPPPEAMGNAGMSR